VIVAVDDPDDERLAPFVSLTDADLRREIEGGRGIFVVEGALALAQLVQSPYQLRSVLVTPAKLDAVRALVGGSDADLFVAGQAVLDRVVGFHLHRGVVATAERGTARSLDSVLASRPPRIAVLERVNDHENLGSLFRNAAAFGIGGVLLDPETADPLYRRTVRVSMGHVLRVLFARAEPWPHALDAIHANGYSVVALTPDPAAEPIDGLAADPPARVAFLIGAEGPGLSAAAQDAADSRVRIPMAPGVDSINVATAAAIAFHRLASATGAR
jgi:tRNA G18 (ribose-2'-O)-methylase SpoU